MARGREAAPEAGSKIDQSCVSSDREEETQRRGTYFSKALRSSSRLRFEDFSQTFPAMLLRLVGTADPAGDCEKKGAGSLEVPPKRIARLRFEDFSKTFPFSAMLLRGTAARPDCPRHTPPFLSGSGGSSGAFDPSGSLGGFV